MKFGRRLQEEAVEEFSQHYIAYKELKKAIKLITGSDISQVTIAEVTNNFGNIPSITGATYRPPESRFQDLLNFELEKINNFSALVYSSICSNLQSAVRRFVHGEVNDQSAYDSARQLAETDSDRIVRLQAYVRLNFIGFRKITKKYDKHNKSSASPFYLTRLLKEKFMNLNLDFLVELTSICFSELRRVRLCICEGIDEVDETCDEEVVDGGTAGFGGSHVTGIEMATTTYLIGEADVMRVRLHLAKHMPITSLGSIRCPRVTRSVVRSFGSGIPEHHLGVGSSTSEVEGPGGTHSTDHSQVVYKFDQNRVHLGCVYFDNPDLEKYRQLLVPQADEMNAEVLRLRWEKEAKPDDGSTVVLEFANAFEPAHSLNEWQDTPVDNAAANIPNALALKRAQVAGFLDGKLTTQGIVSELQLDVQPAASAGRILERARNLLQDNNYRQAFQKWCHRTTFRELSGGSLRMVAHLDESIRFSQAGDTTESASSIFTSPGYLPSSELGAHACAYGVLSISLAGATKPKFLPEITGLTTVTEVWRYAPHLHGTALVKRSALANSELPHWFKFVTTETDEANQDSSGTNGEKPRVVKGGPEGRGSALRVDVVSTKPGSRLLHEHAVALQQDGAMIDDRQSTTSHHAIQKVSAASSTGTSNRRSRGFSALNEPLLPAVAHVGVPINAESQVPYTAFTSDVPARARLPTLAGAEIPEAAQSIFSRITDFVTGTASRCRGWLRSTTRTEPMNAAATVRVEPKTFFANERTLLQWMNTAVLLSTISITLLNFGTSMGRVAGLIMAPVALFFIIYSFLVYLRRSYSLERKEPINYNDRVGPAILVLCLIAALSAIILLNIVYGPGSEIGSQVPPSSQASELVPAANRAANPVPVLSSFTIPSPMPL